MKIQYRTMYKLIMTLLAAAAALMIAGYVVLHPDISANQKERSRLIGASYMTMNNEFYEILNEQISHRVEAEGDRLILRNPALSVSRQVEQIGKMLDEGISVLILTPVDSDGLTDILKKARQQGVKIIVVDSNVSDEQLVDCTIVSDNYRAGCLLGDYLLQNKENSKVVMEPAAFEDSIDEGCINPDNDCVMLGDIVINAEKVKEQAAEYGHSEMREFAFLIAHSMLHLCGYDHMTPEEAEVMEERQEKALTSLGITRQ